MDSIIEKKSNNKSTIIGIVFLIIGVLCLSYSILTIIGTKEPPSKKETSDIYECEQKNGSICTINVSSKGKQVDKKYKLGNKVINLKVELMENTSTYSIKLDGNEIFKTDYDSDRFNIDDVYIMGDIIIVITSSTDINTNNIFFFDNEGKQIKAINNVEDTNPDMRLSSYEVSDNTIIFKRTLLRGESTAYIDEVFIPLINPETCESLLEGIEISKDLVVTTKYEIKYLENNNFTDIKTIEEKTALDIVNEQLKLCNK